MEHPHTLDTVEFIEDVGKVPAGTIGAVVTEYPSSALVEIVGDPEGSVLDDLISVPYESMRLVESATPAALH